MNAESFFRSDWLKPYSRVTSSGRYLPVIDGLRCVAILAVIMYHLEDYLVHKSVDWNLDEIQTNVVHRLLHVGNSGVQLFFTLSGFILSLPFIDSFRRRGPGVRLDRYFLRRLTRLEPPYLINLAVSFLLLVLIKGLSATSLWPHLLASIFYMHNIVYGEMSTINGVAWSLEIEVQFYVLAPLLACLLLSDFVFTQSIWRRSVLIGLAGLVISGKVFEWYPENSCRMTLLYQLDHFLVGMLLADLFIEAGTPHDDGITTTRSVKAVRFPGWLWDGIGLAGWASIVAVQLFASTQHFLSAATFIALLGTLRGVILPSFLSLPVFVCIGGMCYTIYLYHFYLISLVGRVSSHLTRGWSYGPALCLQAVLIVPVTIVCCAILFRWFERPFMQWRIANRPHPETRMSADASPLVRSRSAEFGIIRDGR